MTGGDDMAKANIPVKLDDESLAMLIDEVSAMSESGRPLIVGLGDLDDRAMGKLRRAAKSVRDSLAQGNSAATSLSALSSKYNTPIRIAMEVMASTGSTEPIHETVRLIRETNEQKRQFRLASVNPILNIVAAATIAFFVLPWILVSISESELIKTAFSPTITEICETFAKNFMLAALATVAVVGLFGGLLYWGLLKSSRRFDQFHELSTFCRWLAIQINPPNSYATQQSGNRDVGRVMETAAEVAGPAFAKSWQGVVENVRGGGQSSRALAMPPGTPELLEQCIVDLTSGQRDGALVAYDLQKLSELYTQKSHRRQTWWTEVLPRSVMWLLMITILILLVRAILAPLMDVVGEVSR